MRQAPNLAPIPEAGAHLWRLERGNGFASGIYDRLAAGGRFSNKNLPFEVQWRLNTLPSASWYSGYQHAFGPNSADLSGWGEDDEDVLFAEDA